MLFGSLFGPASGSATLKNARTCVGAAGSRALELFCRSISYTKHTTLYAFNFIAIRRSFAGSKLNRVSGRRALALRAEPLPPPKFWATSPRRRPPRAARGPRPRPPRAFRVAHRGAPLGALYAIEIVASLRRPPRAPGRPEPRAQPPASGSALCGGEACAGRLRRRHGARELGRPRAKLGRPPSDADAGAQPRAGARPTSMRAISSFAAVTTTSRRWPMV
jgi:hypothetical protein